MNNKQIRSWRISLLSCTTFFLLPYLPTPDNLLHVEKVQSAVLCESIQGPFYLCAILCYFSTPLTKGLFPF